jgi:16S rRNA (cytosine1407-C5)-methyltransferase
MAGQKRRSQGNEPGKRAEFIQRVAQVYGVRPEAVPEMLSGVRKQSVRINRLAGRPAEAIRADLVALCEVEPIDWCPDAFYLLEGKAGLVDSTLFRDGEVYIQIASSLVPGLVLDPQPGESILDLAAAPGGKASHLAALSDNKASLWLNDALAGRLKKLESVASLMHVEYTQMTAHPAQYADKFIEQSFDRILLDAQCTGEGRVDLHKASALRFWSTERVDEYGYLQQRMLAAAFKLLKPGGILVYTTCTISPEENERPVDNLLSRFEDCHVRPIEIDFDYEVRLPGLRSWNGHAFHPDLSMALRIRPHEFFEPFFVCKLQKAA